MMLTPLHISIMISCVVSRTPWKNMGAVWSSEAGCECRDYLSDHGLIGDAGQPTERGKRWVSDLLSVPFPATGEPIRHPEMIGTRLERESVELPD